MLQFPTCPVVVLSGALPCPITPLTHHLSPHLPSKHQPRHMFTPPCLPPLCQKTNPHICLALLRLRWESGMYNRNGSLEAEAAADSHSLCPVRREAAAHINSATQASPKNLQYISRHCISSSSSSSSSSSYSCSSNRGQVFAHSHAALHLHAARPALM
ncbi:unnamed protein product [Pleuronectes platessa]|uniref:Uncharacterized protein n=1 Tax=Pleuronectes platessa TaxID=8262 RepID=A0A9N7TGI5_PLEPL|nr:unnamed protein product [Pleuronectes platessa]